LVVASRGSVWNKHAGPEHAEQYEPDGVIYVDSLTHETVTEVDVTEESPVVTVAPQVVVKLVEPIAPKVRHDWQSLCEIDGRTYRRADKLVPADEVVAP
jgi:hypothetical protein